jgi:hypothetical protein
MPAAKRVFYLRAFVTFYLVLSAIIIAVSGSVLYIAPPGRIANWSYWPVAALEKARWQAVHTIFAFLFVATASLHVYFNWRVILGYVRTRLGEGMRRKWELAASVGLAVGILTLTVAGVPPFSTVMSAGENLKNSWATAANEPPVPHAETWTLAKFSEVTKVPVADAMANLKRAGIEVANSDATLLALARRHGMTPQQVYAAARGTENPAHVPLAEGGGYGRKTVQQICDQVGVPVETALRRLEDAGIEATATDNIRQLATTHSRVPIEIAKLIEGSDAR